MYTQYTVIREIKDRTEFMYTQYTVKYDPENGILCSKQSHDLEQITCILRFYLEETISSYLVSN